MIAPVLIFPEMLVGEEDPASIVRFIVLDTITRGCSKQSYLHGEDSSAWFSYFLNVLM